MFTQKLNEQETGAPKTLKQLTAYMLDYVGAVNISAGSSNSAYYNAKNKTMHFYTSGDDFGITTFIKILFSNRHNISKLMYQNSFYFTYPNFCN